MDLKKNHRSSSYQSFKRKISLRNLYLKSKFLPKQIELGLILTYYIFRHARESGAKKRSHKPQLRSKKKSER